MFLSSTNGAQIISDLKIIAKWDDDNLRREKSAKYLNYYNNYCRTHFNEKVDNIIKQSVDENAETKKYYRNFSLTQEVINKISLAFNSGIEVELISDNENQKVEFNEIIKDLDLQANLIEVDRMCNLLKDVLVVPTVQNNKIKLTIVTPNLYFVIQDENDPTIAKAVVYQVCISENTAVAEVVTKHIMIDEFGFWNVEISNTGQVLKKERVENQIPYNTAPFVIFRNYKPTSTFFSQVENDIVEAQENINYEFSNLMYSLDRNYPTLVAKNVPEGTNIPTGRSVLQQIKDDVLGVGVSSDLFFLSANYNVMQSWESIEKGVEKIYNKYNLSYLSNNTTFTSGFQIMMAKSELYEANNINTIYYKNSIRELIDLVMQASIYLGSSISKDYKFTVTIKKPDIQLSPLEEEQVIAMQLASGYKNVIDVMLEKNKDLTREDAVELYKSKQDETRTQLTFTSEAE